MFGVFISPAQFCTILFGLLMWSFFMKVEYFPTPNHAYCHWSFKTQCNLSFCTDNIKAYWSHNFISCFECRPLMCTRLSSRKNFKRPEIYRGGAHCKMYIFFSSTKSRILSVIVDLIYLEIWLWCTLKFLKLLWLLEISCIAFWQISFKVYGLLYSCWVIAIIG